MRRRVLRSAASSASRAPVWADGWPAVGRRRAATSVWQRQPGSRCRTRAGGRGGRRRWPLRLLLQFQIWRGWSAAAALPWSTTISGRPASPAASSRGSPPSGASRHRRISAALAGCDGWCEPGATPATVRTLGSHPHRAQNLRKSAAFRPSVRRVVRTANPESRPVASEISRRRPPYPFRRQEGPAISVTSRRASPDGESFALHLAHRDQYESISFESKTARSRGRRGCETQSSRIPHLKSCDGNCQALGRVTAIFVRPWLDVPAQ